MLAFAGIAQQASLTGAYWPLVPTNRLKRLKSHRFSQMLPTAFVAARFFELSGAPAMSPWVFEMVLDPRVLRTSELRRMPPRGHRVHKRSSCVSTNASHDRLAGADQPYAPATGSFLTVLTHDQSCSPGEKEGRRVASAVWSIALPSAA